MTAKRRGVRKAHNLQALPRPTGLKQCSFPAKYRAVKPRPANATMTTENSFRVAGSGLFGQYKTALLLFKSFRLEIYIYFFTRIPYL